MRKETIEITEYDPGDVLIITDDVLPNRLKRTGADSATCMVLVKNDKGNTYKVLMDDYKIENINLNNTANIIYVDRVNIGPIAKTNLFAENKQV